MGLEVGLSYTMYLEVYLQAAVVRGILVTNQDRLSNFLMVRQGEEVFSMKDATLESLNIPALHARGISDCRPGL